MVREFSSEPTTLSKEMNSKMQATGRSQEIIETIAVSQMTNSKAPASSRQRRRRRSFGVDCKTLFMLLLLLIAAILFNCISSAAAIQQANNGEETQTPIKKCNEERHAEMDKCASNLGFLGDRTFIMPRNVSQMNGFCGTLTKSLKCIQSYARECLTSFPRQVLLTVTRNGRKQYSQLCANDENKQEFMNKLTCLDSSNLEQLHQCMDGSIARFEYVGNRVETDNRISAICCSYQIFKRDIQETVERTCSSFPNVNQTADYLHEIISTTTGELIDLVCGNYKTFEECRSRPKMASLVSTFTEITAKTKSKLIKPKAKSLISLFVSILNSF